MPQLSIPGWIRWWFRGAAIYGTLGLLSLPARATPMGDVLFYYGFIGTALGFQLVFWIIGSDPLRYRRLMPAAVIEKLAFVLPSAAIIAHGGAGAGIVGPALVDLALGLGFFVAWRATPTA